MKSLYNIGDTVIVKSRYDEGCSQSSYRFVFLPNMIEYYGGKSLTILGVSYRGKNFNNQVEDDGYCYTLKEDECNHWWSSSMFEPEF